METCRRPSGNARLRLRAVKPLVQIISIATERCSPCFRRMDDSSNHPTPGMRLKYLTVTLNEIARYETVVIEKDQGLPDSLPSPIVPRSGRATVALPQKSNSCA